MTNNKAHDQVHSEVGWRPGSKVTKDEVRLNGYVYPADSKTWQSGDQQLSWAVAQAANDLDTGLARKFLNGLEGRMALFDYIKNRVGNSKPLGRLIVQYDDERIDASCFMPPKVDPGDPPALLRIIPSDDEDLTSFKCEFWWKANRRSPNIALSLPMLGEFHNSNHVIYQMGNGRWSNQPQVTERVSGSPEGYTHRVVIATVKRVQADLLREHTALVNDLSWRGALSLRHIKARLRHLKATWTYSRIVGPPPLYSVLITLAPLVTWVIMTTEAKDLTWLWEGWTFNVLPLIITALVWPCYRFGQFLELPAAWRSSNVPYIYELGAPKVFNT
jgi:hypothetical protein